MNRYAYGFYDYRSRYSRYDSDRRSRSPRDRSLDRYNDRGSQYGDNDRRRLSGEARANQSAFQSNRENFRDSLTGREPPRGPKALLDPPSGPRGGGYTGDFRGRGRGGRGRGWRDDSRDRGRDRDDFRDRRDGPPFRDERSRERERDWRERDNFRGRRPSPPGRGRSPPPGRDFRDRDVPLGVDADRSRRGSRDGPLSAGSSSSDPVFASQSYRGGFGGRGRGVRGRGDWDRARGRGGYYDDRDQRYPRSRSQEGRWGRNDRDDRDVHRYLDPDPRARDPRDERDMRDREPVRPKPDRSSVSHEAPAQTKDVSPPPVAPSAPAFGSVPSRTTSSADIQSLTGKAPPTGPRALTEERSVPAPPTGPAADVRPPPPGPGKIAAPEGSPPIPLGPRAQMQKQRPSSKQWINPSLNPKKIPETPKIGRSQSFVSPQSRPFGQRPGSSGSDFQAELVRRPRSSDSKAESHPDAADTRHPSLSMTEPGEITEDTFTPSTRTSVDREMRDVMTHVSKTDNRAPESIPQSASLSASVKTASPKLARIDGAHPGATIGSTAVTRTEHQKKTKRPKIIHAPVQELPGTSKGTARVLADQGSESDDEDIDDYFNLEISKAETELRQLEGDDTSYLETVITRAGLVEATFALNALSQDEGLFKMLEPIPEDLVLPRKSNASVAAEKEVKSGADAGLLSVAGAGDATNNSLESKTDKSGLQPKEEEPDAGVGQLPIPTVENDEARPDVDVVMKEAAEHVDALKAAFSTRKTDKSLEAEGSPSIHPDGPQHSRPSSPSHEEEDDDATEIEEIDDAAIEIVRTYMKTPPIDELPDFTCTPWYQDKQFIKAEAPSTAVDAFILKTMKEENSVKLAQQQGAQKDYGDKYRIYLEFTLSDDPLAVKSREKFTGGAPIPETNGVQHAPAESKPEGRGLGRRFASERDLERILQESMRAEEERREREERAQREKYRSEKEAEIPEMYWTEDDRVKDLYIDRTGNLPVAKLAATWQLLPPVVNFTEEEAALFEKAYLEFPKQWGRIAEQVPTRDFHDCIQYYYSQKRDLNLKEKLKKQPRRRKKGSRKQRSSALVSELGNGENETEENHETGENGERRRPRRAAAPTFNFEATPAADSDGNTPAGTPGRRRGAANESKNDSGAEKPEGGRRGRKRATREKEPKQPKQAQVLVPTPPATAKAARSRSNSRAQTLDLAASQAPAEASRLTAQFEAPPVGMQAPIGAPPPIAGADRTAPTAPSSISEVMAPPSLRPEPPPPQVGMPTFELSQPDRVRTPQQASSYWSVSESNDFPALLRSFGTDWSSIAAHMQTKTAVMVKNYYVRQKDGGKAEWERIATDADAKRARGEKRPAPPTPTTGPRKRYDTPHANPRPLAAADTLEDVIPSKADASASQGLGQALNRFQVPVAIASAPPSQAALGPAGAAPPLSAQQHTSPQVANQAMSPTTHPLRPPVAQFAFGDREAEASLHQPGRTSQKPAPPPISESIQQRPAWTNDVDAQLQSLAQRQAQRQMQQREEPRLLDQLRLKQEPDVAHTHEPFASQGPSRGALRSEPFSARPRANIAPSQAYPATQPGMRTIMGEPVTTTPQPPIHRSAVAEAYGPPSSQASTPSAPPPSRAPEKRSNLMALLNDDPPPKRVSEVTSAVKPSPTPPPSMASRPPPPAGPAPSQLRREPEPAGYSPYSRNAPPQASMPSLKPYSNQSPQPQQMNLQRPPIISPIESASAERDYYSRHPYQPQHQGPPSNSPQVHHYPPPGQQQQMGYQAPPPSYSAYNTGVSQPHSASPTPQYAGHPSSASGRREQPPPSRETAWPTPDSRGPPQPSAWPQNAPPKASQPPAQSAWGAQHGGPPKPTAPNSSMPQQPSWAAGGASQQQPPPHHMSMRDDRGGPGYPVHDGRPQHQHSHSLGSRYSSTPGPRPGEGPQPPPPQGPYQRYSNTPGPPQGRDLRDPGPPRSYTPVSAYDSRGPPPPPPPGPPYGSQDVHMRDMGRDPRGDPNQGPGMLQRTLRPHDEYGRPPDNRYR